MCSNWRPTEANQAGATHHEGFLSWSVEWKQKEVFDGRFPVEQKSNVFSIIVPPSLTNHPSTMFRAASYLVTASCLLVATNVTVAQAPLPTDSLRVEVAEDESAAAEMLITTVGPGHINFQGFAEFGGVPFTGSLNVAFRIFDVASGGTDIWGELQTLVASEAVFTAAIGSVNPLTLPFDKPYWLAIRPGTDPWMAE